MSVVTEKIYDLYTSYSQCVRCKLIKIELIPGISQNKCSKSFLKVECAYFRRAVRKSTETAQLLKKGVYFEKSLTIGISGCL